MTRKESPTNCIFRLFYTPSLCSDCEGYCKSYDPNFKESTGNTSVEPEIIPVPDVEFHLALVA